MPQPFFLLRSLLLLGIFSGLNCQSGEVPARLRTSHAPLNDKLARTISADADAISPAEAKALDDPIFLDARETTEYDVSHLPNARRLGYNQPDFSILADEDPTRPIVVYCTIGYRSERMAAQLRKRGFERVYNLYGSIYAWSLAGFPLEDASGQPTQQVHTYNRKWGTYYPVDAHKVY